MEAIIRIEGQIGSVDGTNGLELSDVISQVKKQPDATSYKVLINSEGGKVDVGFDIYNYIKSLGLPVTTVGNGLVASIATVIFMAGSQRVVREGTLFMIHLPMGSTRGTSEQIQAYSKAVKKVEKRVTKFYMENFGLQKEAIEPLLKNETWLTENQLNDLGITTMEPLNVAAKATITIGDESTKQKPMADKTKTTDESILTQIFTMLKTATGSTDALVNQKVLNDETMRELKFPELKKDAVVNEGDYATIADQPASGDIRLQDGRIMTFENGKVTKIKEKEKEADPAIAAMQTEIATMKATLEASESEKTALAGKLAIAEAKAAQHETVINSIMKLQSDVETGGNRDNTNLNQGGNKKAPSRFEQAVSGIRA